MACLFWAASLSAQTEGDLAERIRILEQQVTELTRRLSSKGPQAGPSGNDVRDRSLADRVTALEAEVRRLVREFPAPANPEPVRTASLRRIEMAVPSSRLPEQKALPSLQRSGTTAAPQSEETRLPVSGYMELNFSKPQEQNAVLDFRRFVLLFGHSFSGAIEILVRN